MKTAERKRPIPNVDPIEGNLIFHRLAPSGKQRKPARAPPGRTPR